MPDAVFMVCSIKVRIACWLYQRGTLLLLFLKFLSFIDFSLDEIRFQE